MAPPPTASAPPGYAPPPGAYPYPYPPPGYVLPPGYAPPGYAPPPGYVYPGYAPPAPAPQFRVEQRWYGWQTLIADGASVALILLASSSDGSSADRIGGLGVAGYLLAAPIVHWSHGHVGRGFASLGLRAGVPLLGLGLVLAGSDALATDTSYSSSDRTLALLGLVMIVASVPTAIAVDAAVIAREEKKVPVVSLVPLVQPRQGGATLGLGGTF